MPKCPHGGRRVNQAREGGGTRQGKITALGVVDFGDVLARKSFDRPGKAVCLQARRVDDQTRAQCRFALLADHDLDAARRRTQRRDFGCEGYDGAGALRIGHKRLHVAVGVDDAGRGRG